MSNLVGVYAGTFDPITSGHMQIINKACKIFDVLHIVVATGEGKSPSFNSVIRTKMIVETISPELISNGKIKISELPKGVYVATYAECLGANFLIRGLRDEFDFHYENQIHRANKRIRPSIETIYIMPDEEFSLVSSSLVKGLVGHGGWREIVKPYVSEYVLDMLVKQYARKRFFACYDKFSGGINDEQLETFKNHIWSDYILTMGKNKYHNINHILDCLEATDLYGKGEDIHFEMAFWLHDVLPSEDDCISLAHFFFYLLKSVPLFVTGDRITSFIKASKHLTCEYSSEDEKLFASIDLLILGSSEYVYSQYRGKIREEYKLRLNMDEEKFFCAWNTGRKEFLENMLKREYIYPDPTLRNKFEIQARKNISQELRDIDRSMSIG